MRTVLYPKNFKQLHMKVLGLLGSDILDKYKEMLKDWMLWYEKVSVEINLPVLKKNEFIRAYCQKPNIFGIQIWKKNGDERIWVSNVYMNDYIETNSDETIIIK